MSWTRPFTWRWTSLFFQRADIRNVTFEKLHVWQNNTYLYIKQIKNRCSTTAGQIVRETTDCYVHSHLLWSKIQFHYLTFSPSLLPYVRAAFCGMGLSLCSVLKEFGKYSEKKLVLFLLDMTLTFVWLIIASNDLINLFVLFIVYCEVTVCVAECWDSRLHSKVILLHFGQHLWPS